MQRAGIVGLPNVGKSTLFSLLTKIKVERANYPFTTIEANKALVELRDPRIDQLVELVGPQKTIRASFEFVDIAGLVRGASRGEGRGNSFLNDIRNVDLIVHVVRCFEDENIIHVDGSPDPIRDIETINQELILADLAKVISRLERVRKLPKDLALSSGLRTLEIFEETLLNSRLLNTLKLGEEEKKIASELALISLKPMLYLANVSEQDLVKEGRLLRDLKHFFQREGTSFLALSVLLESELVDLSDSENKELLASFNLTSSGLDRLIATSFEMLKLATFFTVGIKEVRAWVFKVGSKAYQAAGLIHSDFSRNFIRARVISFEDFINLGGESKAKELGRLRIEGRDYLVEDGDIIHFLTSR